MIEDSQGSAALSQALRLLFELSRNPAAICDSSLGLITCNPAFERLCDRRCAAGERLTGLLEMDPVPRLDRGASAELIARNREGHELRLILLRADDLIAVSVREESAPVTSPPEAGPQMQRMQPERSLLELGRELASAQSEEELVSAIARGITGMFPGRRFCIRITNAGGFQLTSLYAVGRMRQLARDRIVLKRRAAEKTHLLTSELFLERVVITDEEPPSLFEGIARSLCLPLVASGRFFGAIDVEWREGLDADLAADERVLIQLGNQAAVAIRNAKLIDELQFVRRYLEELLEHANALILTTDREGKILIFNNLVQSLTGMRKDQILGRQLSALVPENERARLLEVHRASLRGEKVSNFETGLTSRTGGEARISLSCSPVISCQGEVDGVMMIGQDITSVKELERQIIQAEKLASLGQFAASVVHEINNPLTAVITYADALYSRWATSAASNPGDQEKLRKILDGCERILRFTRQLVSYARPVRDRSEPVELNKLLDTATSFCDHILNHHGIAIEKDYGAMPPLPAVKGNLAQVFVNLITNACQSMQPGGIVQLSTRLEGRNAVIRVRDTGSGIEKSDLQRIFNPFFTTKPDGKGTGLGLSIAQNIVQSHGGRIEVQSSLGSGTTFVVQLPTVVATKRSVPISPSRNGRRRSSGVLKAQRRW